MRNRITSFVLCMIMVLCIFPVTTFAAGYTPPTSYGAPQNPGVVFAGDIKDTGRWGFDITIHSSDEVRSLLQADIGGDDSILASSGYNSLNVGQEWDYKIDNGKWRSELPGYEEWVPQSYVAFNAEDGTWSSAIHAADYQFSEVFPDGILPGGGSYFDSHTIHFRAHFAVDFYNDNTSENISYKSPWSSEVSYSNSQKVEDPAKLINHAPSLLSVELKKEVDGKPYLEFTADKAHSDIQKLNSISDERVFTDVWIRVNGGEWVDAGDYLWMKEKFTVEANDYFKGVENTDAAVYEVKFRYTFDYEYYPVAGKSGTVYSPFSNVISHGMPAFSGASSWALPELNKAQKYGFITDKIKDNMSGPITREEFAEVAVKLYEKYTGKTAVPADANTFADTQNPEIFKAYNLNIVAGTDLAKKLFSPKDLTNREQVAAMIYRAVKVIEPGADLSNAGSPSFSDSKQVSGWATENVKFMSKLGFMKGSNNRFDPKGTCTREQAVLIAVRVYELYAGIK